MENGIKKMNTRQVLILENAKKKGVKYFNELPKDLMTKFVRLNNYSGVVKDAKAFLKS